MFKGQNLIYFAPEKWSGLWRNRQQLMSVFARENRVLFVEPRQYLKSTLAGFRRGDLGWFDLSRPLLEQISEDLFVFRYPIWASISGRFPLKQFTKTMRHLALQKVLRELQMSQPIVWFSRPKMIDLINAIPSARLRIYHVVDEYAAYSNLTQAYRSRVEEQEKKMMSQVDMVIVVSKNLYEAKSLLNENTYLVPNGVNFQAYTAALDSPCLPADLEAIQTPRLGYSGLIGDKLDLTMLKELALKNPQWSLVFLGEAKISKQASTWQALQALPNVHHLGLVEVSQVPYYLKGFQVGLMPYMQNRHAENISPLKLYDYLAAGLPVASLDIPAAREFSPYIHLAKNPENFSQAVREALVDIAPERYQARRNVAAQHTWEARVEQLSVVIQNQLAAPVQSVKTYKF